MSEHPFKIFQAHPIRQGARRSAQEIVPLLLERLTPQSVVDVGCGTGTWLSVFRQRGIVDTIGIDGDWVDRSALEIPAEQFVIRDLRSSIHVERTFDLVVSLEVAHYLPASVSSQFVHSLTNLGSVVLFSSAIPGQWGAHHVHEQWPKYWANLFNQYGFVAVDFIRQRVWDNKHVDWWYAQNALLFARGDIFEERLAELSQTTPRQPLSLVHPQHYEHHRWMYRVLRASMAVVDRIPQGETITLIDEGQFGCDFASGRNIARLLEIQGQYHGPPADGETAVAELDRHRVSGTRFLVIGWPAFWWFDYYVEFEAYLDRTCSLIYRNEDVFVFALRNGGAGLAADSAQEFDDHAETAEIGDSTYGHQRRNSP